MEIKLIKTEADYKKALIRLNQVFDSPDNTPDGDEAEILILLIDNYESKYYSIEPPDPIEAIKIRMEDLNMKQKDLIGVIGGKSRVSEVLNKKKRLTVEMIRNLASKLNLSASILINNYTLSE